MNTKIDSTFLKNHPLPWTVSVETRDIREIIREAMEYAASFRGLELPEDDEEVQQWIRLIPEERVVLRDARGDKICYAADPYTLDISRMLAMTALEVVYSALEAVYSEAQHLAEALMESLGRAYGPPGQTSAKPIGGDPVRYDDLLDKPVTEYLQEKDLPNRVITRISHAYGESTVRELVSDVMTERLTDHYNLGLRSAKMIKEALREDGLI